MRRALTRWPVALRRRAARDRRHCRRHPAGAARRSLSRRPRSRPYTLDSGDRLRVVVFGQDGLTNSYVVDASGHIDMPLIGSVLARGATTDELATRIADRLRQGFIREPHVAVEIEAYRPFFILGEVTQPGQYPYVANMTVETAVAIAGGFSPRAYRRTVTVSRVINGRQVRMTVPVTFPLRPGDTVNVGALVLTGNVRHRTTGRNADTFPSPVVRPQSSATSHASPETPSSAARRAWRRLRRSCRARRSESRVARRDRRRFRNRRRVSV